ncbi:HGL213Wp [Eremothecium sinecaudum]|uniref:HGL213Wp n=1 Tax=Eremothecium sinecaudum TaxID=45286 RepID=A0A120K2P0_9SACH|nr:HGL213Wp [Eremothecium sinecaudum]AMD22127.1 HGL213Wp [Eremothecium sinecaudum]
MVLSDVDLNVTSHSFRKSLSDYKKGEYPLQDKKSRIFNANQLGSNRLFTYLSIYQINTSLMGHDSYSTVPLELKLLLTTINCAKLFPNTTDARYSDKARQIIQQLTTRSDAHDVFVLAVQEFSSLWQAACPGLVRTYLDNLAPIVLHCLNKDKESALEHKVSSDSVDGPDAEPLLCMSSVSPSAGSGGLAQVPINGKQLFRHVTSSAIGAIGIMIFARNDISVQDLQFCSVRCGLFNSSLKGATAVQILLSKFEHTHKFTFISAHFTASDGHKKLLRRINDGNTIMKALKAQFGGIFDGYVFLLGDLNFRLHYSQESNTKYNDREVTKHLLEEQDELNSIRATGILFHDFKEPVITFPPTYKYHLGSGDKYVYNLTRQPSWCDRILYKSANNNITVHEYRSIDRTPHLEFTDHQAVTMSVSTPLLYQASPFSLQKNNITERLHIGHIADRFIYVTWYIHEIYGVLGDILTILLLVVVVTGIIWCVHNDW